MLDSNSLAVEMKVRPRARKIQASSRKPLTSVSYGLPRLLIVFGAAGFLLWVLASRSDYILGKGSKGRSVGGSNDVIKDVTGASKEVGDTTSADDLTAVSGSKSDLTDSDKLTGGAGVSYRHLKPGENGKFEVRTTPIKTHVLRQAFDRNNLKKVNLDFYRFGFDDESDTEIQTKACKGSVCPDFDYCYRDFESIGACLKPSIEDSHRVPTKFPANCPGQEKGCAQEPDFVPHERWASQIFVLHDVYVNVAGQIFNETHFFDTNACTSEQSFKHVPGKAKVTEYGDLVSLVDWFGWNARSNMLDILPMLVSLDAVMPQLKGVPVAYGHRLGHRRTQLEQMQAIGVEDILGVELDTWNPQILRSSDLFFAKNLFLPLHQPCGKPSRALWQHIRSNYFLAKGGLPMYSRDWLPRTATPGGQPLTNADDWVVLLGMKKEKAPLVDTLNLEKHLLEMFPKGRVQVYFEGALPMPRRKELLNRARLLIAVHENVLADMVYMPPGGSILEIRPKDDPDATFHRLAEVCGLEYHLMFCNGHKADPKRPSNLKVRDPKPIIKAIKDIADKING